MKCKICKTNLSDNTTVCYKCGYRLKFEPQQPMHNYNTILPPQQIQNNYTTHQIISNNSTPPPCYINDTPQYYNDYTPMGQSYPNPQPIYQRSNWNSVDENYQYKFLIGFLISIIIILAAILIVVIINYN